MVLTSPAKNALFDSLFGIGLNSDILTFFICIVPWTFVVARASLFIQRWHRHPKKNSKKKYTFACVLFFCLYLLY